MKGQFSLQRSFIAVLCKSNRSFAGYQKETRVEWRNVQFSSLSTFTPGCKETIKRERKMFHLPFNPNRLVYLSV